MFSFLAIIGAIASIILFGGMISSNFEDPSTITSFISMLFSTILCFKLARMDQKISDNEDEIQKLKKHLGIKDGDPINENSSAEDPEDELEYVQYDGDPKDFEIYENEPNDKDEE